MTSGNLVFNHITTYLNFDDNPSKKKCFTLAVRDCLSDLSFVYADFLFYYIKKGYPVILVNLAQSFHHYSQIMLKSGINLRTLRESKKVISVDFLAGAENVINRSDSDLEHLSFISSLISNSSDNHSLKPLYDSIQNAVETATKSHPEQFLILIDEINVLLNLGVTVQALDLFVRGCYSYCIKVSEFPGMLLVGSVLDSHDEENRKQVNFLSHICDIELQVEGLKTGFSKDIQGKITFKEKDNSRNKSTNQKFFFKVEDKGSKFFADGL